MPPKITYWEIIHWKCAMRPKLCWYLIRRQTDPNRSQTEIFELYWKLLKYTQSVSWHQLCLRLQLWRPQKMRAHIFLLLKDDLAMKKKRGQYWSSYLCFYALKTRMNATFMTNATIQRFKRKQDAGKPFLCCSNFKYCGP